MEVDDEFFKRKILHLYFYFELEIANLADQYKTELLTADEGARYDRVIDINLSEVKRDLFVSLILKIFFSLYRMLMVHLHLILHIQ